MNNPIEPLSEGMIEAWEKSLAIDSIPLDSPLITIRQLISTIRSLQQQLAAEREKVRQLEETVGNLSKLTTK